jgi:hypothetical protein
MLLIILAASAEKSRAGQGKNPGEKIVWGKEVNGLAVSIAPAKEEGKFIVRWKNLGKETLELPWVRFNSNAIYKHLDDLLGHVALKGPDGKLAPTRTYKFPIIGATPYRLRTVILDSDKAHVETMDLWTYVDKPAAKGRYQMSIDLEVKNGFAPSKKGAKYWTGKIESNVLEINVEIGKDKPKAGGDDKPAAKPELPIVRKLVEQLKSGDFKTREKAVRELSKLEEVPDALRDATKSDDLEARRRAQAVVDIIKARLDEKAFQTMIADLHKVEVDHFIRRMVTDEKFNGDKEWKVLEILAKAVTKKANELGGRKFEVPDFDFTSLPAAERTKRPFGGGRILFDHVTANPTSVHNSVLLSAGATPYITSVSNSIVFVDGDFGGATGIDNSLVIVRGNVGRCTVVHKSIVIATGNFIGATGCDESFLQVNNQRIRFTGSSDSVLVKTAVKTTGPTTSRVLDTEKGPLQLLKFSARKTDAQLAWGKEVNGLAVAITPVEQKDKFLIRWKNLGKELLEIPWSRFNSDIIDSHLDDLLGHVSLKGPDGKLVAARQYQAPMGRRPPPLVRNVVLGPDQTHEEIIDLWAYVDKPAAEGRYQLSIGMEPQNGRMRREWEAKLWTGKIESNVLEIKLAK